jgi:excinuclease ABC subunit C
MRPARKVKIGERVVFGDCELFGRVISVDETGNRMMQFEYEGIFEEVLDRLGLRGKIAIIGIAERLEEIYFPGDSVPLYINKNSESLRVIQHLRDEAHRFGITHHRKRRAKSQTRSELDAIKGIGDKTKTALLTHFKSVKRIREATLDQIAAIIGPAKAQLVHQALTAKK